MAKSIASSEEDIATLVATNETGLGTEDLKATEPFSAEDRSAEGLTSSQEQQQQQQQLRGDDDNTSRDEANQAAAAAAAALPKQPPAPILSIRLVTDKVGFGVFALRPFARGQLLYEERVALEAVHSPHKHGARNAWDRLAACSAAELTALHAAFPGLAAATGDRGVHVPAGPGDMAERIGSRLVGGSGLLACTVTPDQWTAQRELAAGRMRSAPRDRRHGWLRGGRGSTRRARMHDWFHQYAFRLSPLEALHAPSSSTTATASPAAGITTAHIPPQPQQAPTARSSTLAGQHHHAAAYLVTCLVNHHCTAANCRVNAGPGTVRVLAQRDIAAGEELRINYQKKKTRFECDCCEEKRRCVVS